MAIGLDYSKKAGKRHVGFSETPVFVKESIQHVIKDVETPVFVKPVSEPLNEQSLLIEEELLVEDLEEKVKEDSPKTPEVLVKNDKSKTEQGNKVEKSGPESLKKSDKIENPKSEQSGKVKAK